MQPGSEDLKLFSQDQKKIKDLSASSATTYYENNFRDRDQVNFSVALQDGCNYHYQLPWLWIEILHLS